MTSLDDEHLHWQDHLRPNNFSEHINSNRKEVMNTEEVGKKLVELCNKGAYEEATKTLYAEDIVSVEPRAMGGMPAEMQGLDAVAGKTKWWIENHEIHHAEATGPFVARDTFVVRFEIDVTDKTSGKRMQASEVGIYQVKDGKVTREEFLPMI